MRWSAAPAICVSSGGPAATCPPRSRSAARGWLRPRSARAINTEAKYLLLCERLRRLERAPCGDLHRFAEHAEPHRRSCASVRTFEGILRSHRGSYAPGEENIVARDSAMYSVIREPTGRTVKRGLGGTTAMSDRRVMLVTGASRGIGAAVARLAAKAGYTVVVNYTSNADAATAVVEEIGNESFAVKADVGDEAAVLAMFAEIDQRCGRLDVLGQQRGHRRRLRHARHVHGRGARAAVGRQPDRPVPLRA